MRNGSAMGNHNHALTVTQTRLTSPAGRSTRGGPLSDDCPRKTPRVIFFVKELTASSGVTSLATGTAMRDEKCSRSSSSTSSISTKVDWGPSLPLNTGRTPAEHRQNTGRTPAEHRSRSRVPRKQAECCGGEKTTWRLSFALSPQPSRIVEDSNEG